MTTNPTEAPSFDLIVTMPYSCTKPSLTITKNLFISKNKPHPNEIAIATTTTNY